MLHPVAKLACDIFRHVHRILRDEIDADALGPDQAHHLFHLVQQGLWCILEQQMRLVEEEDQFRLVGIAHIWKRFEQVRKQPEKEGEVEIGRAQDRTAATNAHLVCRLLLEKKNNKK